MHSTLPRELGDLFNGLLKLKYQDNLDHLYSVRGDEKTFNNLRDNWQAVFSQTSISDSYEAAAIGMFGQEASRKLRNIKLAMQLLKDLENG